MVHVAVGRKRELATASDFLGELELGPAVLLLEGEPGIGKTTLWREIGSLAEGREFRVLRVLPAEAERSLSFAGLADLLDGVDLNRFPELPPVQRNAVDAALLRGNAVVAPDPRSVFTGVLTILRALASNAPVLVAVDDLQWLDPPSARALQFVARRLGQHRVGFLVSARLAEQSPVDALLAALEGISPRRVRVGPLSLAAMHQVVLERLDRSFQRPTLRRIYDAAGGNPLFGLEIASALGAKEPPPGEPLPVPADVEMLVRARISRLPKATKHALVRAALASEPTALLIGPSLGAALKSRLIRELSDGRLAFVHPLYASAVCEAVTAQERGLAHRELAAEVVDVEERARHLALATGQPDEAVASELDRAAAQARARGAPDIASELQEWAFELTPAGRDRAARARTLAAAEDHLHAGALARARSLLARDLHDADDPAVRSQALRLLAEVSLRERSIDEAFENLRAAAAAAGDDPVLRGPVERDLVFACVFVSFDLEAARSHAEALIAAAESSGDDGLLAEALAHATMIDFLLGAGVDEGRLARALALEERERRVPVQFTPTYLAGSLAFYRGRYARARSLLRSLRTRLRERGAEGDLPMVSCTLALVECVRGELPVAWRCADEAYEVASLTESETGKAMALVTRALVDAHAGLEERCRDSLDAAFRAAERAGLGLVRLQGMSILGFLELSLGNPAAACAAFEPWWRELGESDKATPSADEIEALVALGELDRAEQLTASLAEWGRAVDAWLALAASHRCRALVRAAQGEPAEALSEIELSLRSCERLHAPLELGRTLLVKGVIERRLKRKAAAKDSLERALATFERLGSPLWVEKARAELARVGLRRTVRDELTESERRVAELAASGLTNREVAARLYMSPKTVEASLARAYRKLGIHSRAELGAQVAGGGRETAET